MGIIINVGSNQYTDLKLNPKESNKQSNYSLTPEEKTVRDMVIRHLVLGTENLNKPRREFNDLSVLTRMSVDQMAFNTYQTNNGDPLPGDLINGWRSRAIRPIVRNKCISIAAHATARLIFPKVFSLDKESNYQKDCAKVMELLMEYSAKQSKYEKTSLLAVISAIVNPCSFIYTEYGDVIRNVKKQKDDSGKWKVESIKDENYSGFKDVVVPCNEVMIENVYEPDIQKQSFVIWRRVISYDQAQLKYKDSPNWKYVKPGVQTLFSDENGQFYDVYDENMRGEMVEEIKYWNKNMDMAIIMVNGIFVTDYDQPNTRLDKQYPFAKFGYEIISEDFFYYKSLAFKMQHDADIINTLYPMIVDGTYLNIMQPMVATGSEAIGSSVIVPGLVTSFSDKDSDIRPINVAQNIKSGIDTLFQVEQSINESSQNPLQQGLQPSGSTTAYEISRIEQNANTVLGLFIKMIGDFVEQYGNLRMSDIIQYLTMIDADLITDDENLIYKTFVVGGKDTTSKIMFEDFETEMTDHEKMMKSYQLMEEEKDGQTLYRVNPVLWREMKYTVVVSPDILQPRSEDLERAYALELFDRAIGLGDIIDSTKLVKNYLFGAYKVKDADEYLVEVPAEQSLSGQAQQLSSPSALNKIINPLQVTNKNPVI